VNSNGTNQYGNKWISLAGSVQSSIDTSLSIQLSIGGYFTPDQPPFGIPAPIHTSFYFDSAQPSPLSSTKWDNATTNYEVKYNTATFEMLAGVAQTFVAYVDAPNNVSLNYLTLFAQTGNYNLISTPKVTNVVGAKQLIGTTALAPVPELESHAMLLAGLGLMGFVARRQKNNQV
jgi:hypothetical protein